ncbi:hypothetical protein SAMN04489735_10714 [Aneurinibacillus thermoaerophilus]|jgi:predicted Fe-S protein YdhL (DUF1289 family)|uniref:Uncharacterized protein n=1 Tax=Aneurinibacillus thermoaerophilus TaxID=143495 RepID=A0A1G8FKJ7_ANETH|nr:hypothetical protein SAMN04489735_10714 [Aneurinibacillus thermoaerophilus]
MNVIIANWLELTMAERVMVLIEVSEEQHRKRGLKYEDYS